jgi:autoinducer 2-degrading protein
VSGYVIIVDFELKPGGYRSFRRLVDANARASVELEAGCRRFDVLIPSGGSDRVMLYEIYDDQAAFDDHCATAHFASFDRESSPLVARKTVLSGELVCEGTTKGD